MKITEADFVIQLLLIRSVDGGGKILKVGLGFVDKDTVGFMWGQSRFSSVFNCLN